MLAWRAGKVKPKGGNIHHRGTEITEKAPNSVKEPGLNPILRALCVSVVSMANCAQQGHFCIGAGGGMRYNGARSLGVARGSRTPHFAFGKGSQV